MPTSTTRISSSASNRSRTRGGGANSVSFYASSVEKKDWFHGMLPREDIARMLKTQGQFLVRITEPKQGKGLRRVLSVFWNNKIRHYIIMEFPEGVCIEQLKFGSITELVEFYVKTKQPISTKSGAKLLEPVPRQNWELHHEQIELGKVLGEGAFGAVHIGKLRMGSDTIKVAVKVNKGSVINNETIREICKEARIMRTFNHPNIVRFYGLAVEREPIMLVMELVDGGALDSYLAKNGTSLTVIQKVQMCLDAAKGLEYLHDKGCIHRDVAARNCLVSGGSVKISDFGLSQELSARGAKYKLKNLKQKLPIRWLAPETLISATYSSKSDVFSYGILMWEIFSNGAVPYPGLSIGEVNVKVKSGYRMEPPDSMPPSLRTILLQHCYPGDPKERWSMMQIRRAIEESVAGSGTTGGNTSKTSNSRKKEQKSDSNNKEIHTEQTQTQYAESSAAAANHARKLKSRTKVSKGDTHKKSKHTESARYLETDGNNNLKNPKSRTKDQKDDAANNNKDKHIETTRYLETSANPTEQPKCSVTEQQKDITDSKYTNTDSKYTTTDSKYTTTDSKYTTTENTRHLETSSNNSSEMLKGRAPEQKDEANNNRNGQTENTQDITESVDL